MDVAKQKKPLHLHCPNCGHDISINGVKVKRNYDEARERVVIIEAKIANERKKNGKSAYYRKLIKDLEEAKVKVIKAKNDWSSICNHGEHELFILFKKKMCARYGRDKIIKIIEECEDEMFYHDNEFMKQNHNNFSGA